MLGDVIRATLRRNRALFAAGAMLCTGISAIALIGYLDGGDLLRLFGFVTAITMGVAATAGIVAADRSSRLYDVWYAKRSSVWSFYLARFAATLGAVTLLLTPLSILLAVSLGVRAGFPLDRLIGFCVAMTAVAWLSSAIVFGLSGAGVRRDAAVAVLFIFVSAQVAAVLTVSEHSLAPLFASIAFPIEALAILARASGDTMRAAGLVGAQLLAWVALGTAGLAFRPARLLED